MERGHDSEGPQPRGEGGGAGRLAQILGVVGSEGITKEKGTDGSMGSSTTRIENAERALAQLMDLYDSDF